MPKPSNPARARAERKVASATTPKPKAVKPKRALQIVNETTLKADPAPAQPDVTGFVAALETEQPNMSKPNSLTGTMPLGSIIASPLNPRRAMDPVATEELMNSMLKNGQLQPILVRPTTGRIGFQLGETAHPIHEIICGARRIAALNLAVERGLIGLDFPVQVRVRECSDSELVILAATENLARADMDPLDEAMVFDALRITLQAEGVEGRMRDAIAARLGISPNTVARRLALLRCAPEVQEALREKKIDLQQAAAFSLGGKQDQAEELRNALTGKLAPVAITPAAIRARLTHSMVPVSAAMFPLSEYEGEIWNDPEAPANSFFADEAAFKRAQSKALDARIAELKADFPFVDIVATYEELWTYSATGPGEQGVVIFADPPLRHIEIREGYRRPAQAQKAAAGAACEPVPKAEPKYLTKAQRVTVAHAKTQAMRLGLMDHSKAALAVTILGLLGERAIHIREASEAAPDDRIERTEIEWARLTELLAPVFTAAGLSTTANRYIKDLRFPRDMPFDKIFTALARTDISTLGHILAALVAARIGTWPGYQIDLGDEPLAIVIADMVDAAAYLPETWTCTREHLSAMDRDRLVALGNAAGIPQANKLKKGELVDALWDLGADFWTHERFHELRFMSGDDLKQALDGPCRVPTSPIMAAISGNGEAA